MSVIPIPCTIVSLAKPGAAAISAPCGDTTTASAFGPASAGRALLQAAVAAAAGETPALRAWGPLGESSPEALLLQAAGFRVTRRLLVFETDAVQFRADMTALLDRMRAAGRVPHDVRLASLAEAPAAEVISLVANQFAALPHDVASCIEPGAANGYDPTLSLVVVRGCRGGWRDVVPQIW
jgi:hypothetical protein